MKKDLILVTTLFLLSATAMADAKSVWKNTEVSAQIGLTSDYVDNKQVEARVFGVLGLLQLDMPFSDTFKLDLGVGAILETGSNNSFIIDEYAPNRLWLLQKAALEWTPFSFLSLEAGAIDQSDYGSPLLVTSSAFLGLRQTISLNLSDHHSFYLKLLQAIPNNINLNQRIGVVQDGTPSYLMQTVGMDLEGDLLALKVEASKFSYNSLSTGIAFQSQFLGNSVSGGSALNSDFLYGFSGYNFRGSTIFMITDYFGLELGMQYLYNDKAPEARNKGHLYEADVILGNWVIGASAFRNESDSSPAYYNSKAYSHNNHEGFTTSLEYRNSQEQRQVEFVYVDSSPIQFNTFQSDTKKVVLNITQDLDF
jgi:hypothetical protein